MVNWSDWHLHLIDKSMAPYETVMGVGAWVLIFTGIVGYVYVKQQSYVAAAVASFVLLTVFAAGGYLISMESWVILITIFMCLAFTGLLLLFISKRRN